MIDLVQLHDVTPPPVPEVVELLERVLAMAQSGEVIGVAVAVSCHAGHDASAYELGEGTVAALYLATGRLQRRILDIGQD